MAASSASRSFHAPRARLGELLHAFERCAVMLAGHAEHDMRCHGAILKFRALLIGETLPEERQREIDVFGRVQIELHERLQRPFAALSAFDHFRMSSLSARRRLYQIHPHFSSGENNRAPSEGGALSSMLSCEE